MHSEEVAAGPGQGAAASEEGRDCSAVVENSNRLPVLAGEIAAAHAECRRSAAEAIRHAIDAGNGLVEAKRLMRHGEWEPWLRANVPGISVRTAQRYMRAAARAGKNDTVSFFKLRDLLKPTLGRYGRVDDQRALILSPSTSPGYTHVTVVWIYTGMAEGCILPMRDDAIAMIVRDVYGLPWPTAWKSYRSIEYCNNPFLAGAQPVASKADIDRLDEIIALADQKLDELGYTGPTRDLFAPESAAVDRGRR
ncbi:MAG: DUF3102 domain-containing protein [Geminicoccaceae bacterium]